MQVSASLLATVLFTSLPSRLPAQSSGAVVGRAVNSITHLGIGDVKVEVAALDANESLGSIATDADGSFRFANLGPGNYVARFHHDYFSSPQNDDIAEQPFAVSAPGEPARIGVELTPHSTLRGRLLDSDGRPMAKIPIQLCRLHSSGVYSADSDREGRFVFENVRPTTYLISARPEDSSGLRPPTYYPGVMDRLQAAPIAIPAGADLAGYEFRLATSPGFRVRGTVLDENGAPVKQARVTFGAPGSEAIVSAGPDGRFEFPAVIPGRWRCRAQTEGAPDYSSDLSIPGGWETKQRGSVEVEVGHEDVDRVEIHLASPFAVDFAIEREDTGNPAGSISLRAVDTPGEMSGAAVDSGGRRRFHRLFPGLYEVSMGEAQPGYYLAAVMLGERDILGRQFELEPGAPAIRAVFRSRPGSVNGAVEGGGRASVVLLPRNEALRGLDAIPRTQCQADGRFEIGGLRPDEYYAWAFDRLDAEALSDPAFVRTLLARAATVRVNRGETTSVTLSMTPWPE